MDIYIQCLCTHFNQICLRYSKVSLRQRQNFENQIIHNQRIKIFLVAKYMCHLFTSMKTKQVPCRRHLFSTETLFGDRQPKFYSYTKIWYRGWHITHKLEVKAELKKKQKFSKFSSHFKMFYRCVHAELDCSPEFILIGPHM